MPAETSLRELIAKAAGGRASGVIVGKVTKTNPLEIQVLNDAKLVLTESNVYVPKHLTDYSVSIHLSGSIDGHSIGTRSCTVYNGLDKGDEVYLLQYEGGQLYFVLDKVG